MGIGQTALRQPRPITRPFAELNQWQRIFAEHRERFVATYEREHGRAGHPNPHVHLVVSEGGLDKQWRAVTYFDTRKLRKLWQYQVVTALKKAVRGTRSAAGWTAKLGRLFRGYCQWV